jgi:hypothetical protein
MLLWRCRGGAASSAGEPPGRRLRLRRHQPRRRTHLSPSQLAASAPPATIFTGGDIITVAGKTPEYAEALVVKGGKIAFVGSKAGAAAAAGPGAVTRDLKGKTLIPGLVDTHSHVRRARVATIACVRSCEPAAPSKKGRTKHPSSQCSALNPPFAADRGSPQHAECPDTRRQGARPS